jgi:hypothetical protein
MQVVTAKMAKSGSSLNLLCRLVFTIRELAGPQKERGSSFHLGSYVFLGGGGGAKVPNLGYF